MDLTDNSCQCGAVKLYSEEYDTFYCEKCNIWIEDICTDRDCVYCNSRPSTPNEQSKQKP